MGDKRVVPTALRWLLQTDAKLTAHFCHLFEAFLPPTKTRTYLKLLEISCHGLPWLAVWIAFFWILWNPELFEMQVNFLFGLLLDMGLMLILKGVTRRRRPLGNKMSDMFVAAYFSGVYSFPSGHASLGVFINCFFGRLVPCLGPLAQTFLFVWAVCVAASRLLLRRHYLLDVLGGALLGLLESALLSTLWISRSTAFSLVSYISEIHVPPA